MELARPRCKLTGMNKEMKQKTKRTVVNAQVSKYAQIYEKVNTKEDVKDLCGLAKERGNVMERI